MQRRFLWGILALVSIMATESSYAQQGKWQRVLIEAEKPYDVIVRAVEASGGRVTQQFTYVNAIAAEVPEEAVQTLSQLPGVQAVTKDVDIQKPANVDPIRARSAGHTPHAPITSEASTPLSRLLLRDIKTLATEHTETYLINNANTRIEKLHALEFTGAGVIVAVIDSGIRNGYKLADEAVIGGIDFVDDGAPGPAGDGQTDWKREANDGHGTFAAGLIAGKASFVVNGVMEDALEQYVPGAIVDGKLPLIGTAPDAQIYVVRVFGENATTGASLSTILASIQHVIDQRVLFDSTQGRKGVKIGVANLSLGVSTLAAGQTLLDTSIDRMLTAGIVPVVSVGNVGPSALTTASPGSSRSAVTVGGTGHAANERIMNEVLYATQFSDEYYLGIGGDIRPYSGTEIAWFSSRGPNADGRLDPDIVASGVGNIGQGYCPDQILDACYKRLSIASGTSFSAPIVSGIAAVLMQAMPQATATQIRNALSTAGRIAQIEPYFDELDRGRGLVDAYGAYTLLASGTVPDVLPAFNPPWDLSVKSNIQQNPGIIVKSGNLNAQQMTGLMPGERAEILYEVPPDAERVIVTVDDVEMAGPQNTFMGDGLFLYVHSAKTSSIGAAGDYRVDGEVFLDGDAEREFVVMNPDTGIMRITLNPDTLNGGAVSATVSVRTISSSSSSTRIIDDTISNGQIKTYTQTVNPGTTRLDFLLTWDHDWSRYPTSDVDLIVCSPDIAAANCRSLGNKKAATLAAPERVSIESPAAGTWTLLVHGFNVPSQTGTGTDNFRVRIKASN